MNNKKEAKVHDGGVTQELIQTWKARYRKVYQISILDEQDKYCGFFRRPDMETMSAVSKISKNDEIKGASTLFDNCWLGGDDNLREDFFLKSAAIKELSSIFGSVTGEIKNL